MLSKTNKTNLSSIIGAYVINFCSYTYEQEALNAIDDIYEFNSLDEFIAFRKKYPEVMRKKYDYALDVYIGSQRKHIIGANHYKRFVKLISEFISLRKKSLKN